MHFLEILFMQKRKRAAEAKIVIVLIYYALLAFFIVVENEQDLANKPFVDAAIQNYFLCEATGHISRNCSRESFEMYSNEYQESLFLVLLMLIPVVNLIFVVNCRQIREQTQQLWRRRRSNTESFETPTTNIASYSNSQLWCQTNFMPN